MPSDSEGQHSWHSGAYLQLLSSPGNVTIGADYRLGGATGGWTSLQPPLEQQDSLEPTAGRIEQLAGLEQSRVKLIDHATLQVQSRSGL